MIQQLKFNEKLSYAPLLSLLMLHYLQDKATEQLSADVIIPMPLHPRRLKERGFNQSLLLLEPVAFAMRSEEHTSELQSPYVSSYAVFCLKKKK